MKIALFGGSFDPPTTSHLVVGEIVSHLVERVVFVPAWHSPLKGEHAVSADDRLNMVKLAVRENCKFEVSRLEIDRGGESHAIDTLKNLQTEEIEPVLVVGADCWRSMHRWFSHRELLSEFKVIVVSRPSYDIRNRKLRAVPKRGVTFLAGAGTGLSSTVVRDRLRRGLSCRYIVPDSVLAYIEEHGLYRTGSYGDGSKVNAGG